MSLSSLSPERKHVISFFFNFLASSSIFSSQSLRISSFFSSKARLYKSFRFSISLEELLKELRISSKNFFSFTVFFTLFLSFQKFSSNSDFSISFNLRLILFFSKIPPYIAKGLFRLTQFIFKIFH